jgi:putative transposase
MARPLRIEFPGALYHLTSRGNARQTIFFDEEDFTDFLTVLGQVAKRYHLLLHSYCLMPNHYHLLIETPEGNLARGMRQLNGTYTQHANQRHQRVGHLFQGRYRSILIDKANYLLELSRYIALNPVRANLVEDPKDWPWSAYPQLIGFNRRIPCLSSDWILAQFAPERKAAIKAYQAFVLSGMDAASPLKRVKGQLFLGPEHFMDQIKHLIGEQKRFSEIPKNQHYAARPSLPEIFQGKDQKAKEEPMYQAYQEYGYTLKDIAEYLGVHYTTVSKRIKRIENEGKN